ncbi:conserved hypothetical protein [Frankia canadensis]|uniref:Uncharacterized protein n=1 Tax=Frankia canadensis TaxID=1836972 RepID=A0A2I2KRH9_9ACTN|nr:hypothetical protein [Frankia canadensis]SNQ48278.1 conserved hypothetical protein [Frankia canadensis]SOU55568.1 conserved hypothetical protein [Frankia canadensis]
MSPILAQGRAGNIIRSLLILAALVLLMRTAYLLWFFHTPAWTSRPHDIRYCGGWYERVDTPDVTGGQATKTAGGRRKEVMRSPVFRPITAYRPGSACPRYLFSKVGKDVYVTYRASED